MAILYFLGGGSAPTDWDDGNNWYTAQSGGTNGVVPTSTDEAVILNTVNMNDGSPASVSNLTIGAGGLLAIITVTVTGSCSIVDGGQAGDNATINGSVTCAGGVIGYMGNPLIVSGSLTFVGSASTEIGTSNAASCNYLEFSSDWSGNAQFISVNNNVIYVYGYTGTASNLTVSGYTYYAGYPTLYYNAAVDNDWNNNLNWWVDGGYTQQSYLYPLSVQDVIISESIYDTTADMYCNNATVNTALTVSTSATLNVTGTITVPSGYGLGSGTNFGPNIVCADAIFNGDAYIVNTGITASGTVTFNDTSKAGETIGAYIIGDVILNDSSEFISGTITGNASFYDTSLFSGGSITGDVTVYYDHPVPFSYGGTITGTLSYSGYPARTVYFYHTSSSEDWGGNFWYTATAGGGSPTYAPNPDISLDNVIIEASVGSNTTPLDATVASLTVNGVATASTYISTDITCDYANFYDSCYLNTGTTLTQSANHGGNSITFSDLSNNQGTLNLSDPSAVFEDGASNDGTVNGDVDVYYPSEKPVGGTVTGFVTYYGYTLYFGGGTNDGDWSNSNNWYLDSANMNPYNDVPSDIMPYHNVIIQNNLTSSPSATPYAYDLNTYGSYPYIENVNITVSNLATFSEETYLGTGATITGDALFENLATNRGGTITGIATFTLSSAEEMISNGYDGTYSDIEFQYGKGVNGSSILGIV